MKHITKHIVFLGALLLTSSGCTQKMPKITMPVQQDTGLLPESEFTEINQDVKLFQADGYLYATGRGEGFGIWQLSSRTFYSGLNTLQTTTGGFNFLGTNPLSVGAIVKAGGILVISSGTGLTFIDVATNVSIPQVVGRLPQVSGQPVGPEFIWQSAVYDSSTNQVYGFRGNQMFTLSMASRTIVSTAAIPDLGCGRGATRFNNRIFVAGCSSLYELTNPNGAMRQITGINAVDIVSTARFLYIHHKPLVNNSYEGIYVYDSNLASRLTMLRKVGSLEPRSFAISPDDQFIYSNDVDANGRGVELNIYRIPWTNNF